MTALMLTADLLFSSRASSAAAAGGTELGIAGSTADLLERAAELQDLRLVILDLTAPGCDAARIVQQLRQTPQPPQILAYAPHVMTGALDAARAAGCDRVLTRGQFDRQLNDLLRASG